MERDTITVLNPEQARLANDLAAVFAAGMHRDARLVSTMGGLSFSRHKHKQYIRLDAARAIGQEARQHLGGDAARQFAAGSAQQFQQPSLSDVHVDTVLTNMSVMYVNDMYIGAQVFPRVQVTKESGKFFVFDREDFFRNEAKIRAPATLAARGGYGMSTSSYNVDEYAFEQATDDRVRKNADFDTDRTSMIFVTDKINMALEQAVQAAIETSGNWTTNATLSGTSQWSDQANSDPFTNIKTARLTVWQQIGRKANTAVMSLEVFEALALHPDLLDRVKYTGTGERPAMVTAQMMAELFGLDQVLIGSTIEDTALEGATPSIGSVWGKHFWVGFVPPAASLNSPAAGYVFTTGRIIDRYREANITSDVVRGREAFDVQPVAAGAGYRIINVIA
jgi:hypothetical protein